MCLLGHNSLHINQNPAKLLLPFFWGGGVSLKQQFKSGVAQSMFCIVPSKLRGSKRSQPSSLHLFVHGINKVSLKRIESAHLPGC